MAVENEVVQQPTGDPGSQTVTTTSEGNVSPSSSSSAVSSTGEKPKTENSQFRALRLEAEERGRKKALAEANKRAQALGFKDYEDMAKTVEAQRATRNGQSGNGVAGRSNGQVRQTNGHGNGSGDGNHQNRSRTDNRPQPQASSRSGREQRIRDRQARRDQAAREAASAKANEAKSEAEQLKLQNQELEERLETERAESSLRLLAHRCGVQDVEYAIILLRRHCEKMSEAELAAFNDEEYFRTTLKKEKAYLYEAQTVPATTGNGTGNGGSESASATPPKASTTDDAARTTNVRGWRLKNGTTVNKSANQLNREEVLGLVPADYPTYLNHMGLSHPTQGA